MVQKENLVELLQESEQQKDHSEYIEKSIYDNLPTLLKQSCEVFKDRNEKDVFLYGALTVLGGAFHNLYAYNGVDKKSVSTNLLTFIIAPPASGKGVLNYSKKLLGKIKETFGLRNKIMGLPKSPLIFPGNNSSAGTMALLHQTKGVGIIIESEIDTIANVMKQEWGNYTDILRKCL